MKIRLFVLAVMTVFLGASPGFGQDAGTPDSSLHRAEPLQLGIYIMFHHKGRCPRQLHGPGGPRLERPKGSKEICYWLRLQNATKWALRFDGFFMRPVPGQPKFIGSGGEPTFALGDGWEAWVHYYSEAEPCPIFEPVINNKRKPCLEIEPPIVFWGHVVGKHWILPGNAVIFPVEKEHLRPRLKISVRFHYEWEGSISAFPPYPDHRVYFRYEDVD